MCNTKLEGFKASFPNKPSVKPIIFKVRGLENNVKLLLEHELKFVSF